MADAADVGQRVLAELNAGRAIAIARAKENAASLQAAVLDECRKDMLRGNGERGRPGRVHRQLKGRFSVSERHVRRILDVLFSESDSGS